MTIRLSTAARVFDMSPTGSTASPGWTTPGFDDSGLDHALALPNCGQFGITTDGTRYSTYWGPRPSDSYLFRQTFFVPKASAYYGSELGYAASAHLTALALNGRSLIPQRTSGHISFHSPVPSTVETGRLAIARYLRPGTNVVTASGDGVGVGCPRLGYTITLHMSGLQRPTPLVLSWRNVPGAARYDVQVWLVKAAPGQTITPDSEVNVAVQTTGPRTTLDDAAMPAGTYEWRSAAVNAHGSVISRWTPAQTVTLN